MSQINLQVLVLTSATREISRLVTTGASGEDGSQYLRRLTCPYANHRPCSFDCAFLGATRNRDGLVFIWCRGSGSRVVIGMADPERTGEDEIRALTDASDWLEEQEEVKRRHGQG